MSLFKKKSAGYYGYGYGGAGDLENSFKTILANIRFMDVDRPIKTMVMTSAVPSEGKSFVALGLARAIASSGKSVLLVECDLRRSSLAGRLGVHAKHGLYAVLSNAASLEESVMPTDTTGLFFLDAEPRIPNPSDLFNSHRFEAFLSTVREAYDYVLLDTPPVGAFVDAAVLSRLADATFLVVRENYTRREQVVAAYDQLVKAGGNVAGVIMNYCSRSGGDYYYYDKYYSHYSTDVASGKRSRGDERETATRDRSGKVVSSPSRMRSAREISTDVTGSRADDRPVTGAHVAEPSEVKTSTRGTGKRFK